MSPLPKAQRSARDAFDVVGGTPLVRLSKLFPDPAIQVFAKLEFYNPSGSIKDRIVKHIIDHAEREGRLKPGGTIVENTSGNTGAAIAMIAALRGYRAILTMPDKVSREKQDALTALGANIVICPTAAPPDSPEHYVKKAKTIASGIPEAIMLDQYNNPRNIEAHYLTTGPEIWAQVSGSLDYFVASGSTGGTVSGCGRYLKERNSNLRVLFADPKGSIYFRYHGEGRVDRDDIGAYEVEGVGEDHLVGCMDFSVIDEMLQFTDRNAFSAARELARVEGIMGGGSSGANIWACQQLVRKISKPATIVTIIPDSGLKYLSKFYNNEWMKARGY